MAHGVPAYLEPEQGTGFEVLEGLLWPKKTAALIWSKHLSGS